MVAYSFKERFQVPIVCGVDEGPEHPLAKGGTIRAWGKKRHARPGDMLQIYTKQRTVHCRKIVPDRPCLGATQVLLALEDGDVRLPEPKLRFRTARTLDAFARFDGFEDWSEMRAFWRETHAAVALFDGIHIRWLDWPKGLLP